MVKAFTSTRETDRNKVKEVWIAPVTTWDAHNFHRFWNWGLKLFYAYFSCYNVQTKLKNKMEIHTHRHPTLVKQ